MLCSQRVYIYVCLCDAIAQLALYLFVTQRCVLLLITDLREIKTECVSFTEYLAFVVWFSMILDGQQLTKAVFDPHLSLEFVFSSVLFSFDQSSFYYFIWNSFFLSSKKNK